MKDKVIELNSLGFESDEGICRITWNDQGVVGLELYHDWIQEWVPVPNTPEDPRCFVAYNYAQNLLDEYLARLQANPPQEDVMSIYKAHKEFEMERGQ